MTLLRSALAAAAALALLAGCDEGSDPAPQATVEHVRIVAAISGGPDALIDVWTLRGDGPKGSRTRLTSGGEVSIDTTTGEGGTLVALPSLDAIRRVEGPAASDPAQRGPVALVEALIDSGHLTPAGTEQRDGRSLEVFAGDPLPFVLSTADVPGARATARLVTRPAGARMRYLRDAASGEPVRIDVPGGRMVLRATGGRVAVPAQRHRVVFVRSTPATAEATARLDLRRAYPSATLEPPA